MNDRERKSTYNQLKTINEPQKIEKYTYEKNLNEQLTQLNNNLLELQKKLQEQTDYLNMIESDTSFFKLVIIVLIIYFMISIYLKLQTGLSIYQCLQDFLSTI